MLIEWETGETQQVHACLLTICCQNKNIFCLGNHVFGVVDQFANLAG